MLRREPTVVTSGWAEGVHDEVKAQRSAEGLGFWVLGLGFRVFGFRVYAGGVDSIITISSKYSHLAGQAMLRPVDARGWSCESYSERVALLELIEAEPGSSDRARFRVSG